MHGEIYENLQRTVAIQKPLSDFSTPILVVNDAKNTQ